VNDAAGTAVPNPTAGQMVQVPDRRNGWHTPSLREALKGPGQLLGPTDVDTHGYSDVWSNDISDVAIRARRQEDADEAAAWEATKIDKGWTHGPPADASDIDKSDFAIGVRREKAREARTYEGSLTKRGRGTLFLTGDDTWHGGATVRAGKLSIVGSHASSIDVDGGTLGGSGSVGRSIDVDGGVLKPGLAPEEAERITDVSVDPGNVLNAGGDVRVGRRGRVAVTIRGDDDYTSVRAGGDLELGGKLALDVGGALTRGTVLTIMSGRSITGRFRALPEGRLVRAGGHLFRVSYRDDSVTLTVTRRGD
jgi:subtilase-type serine protease